MTYRISTTHHEIIMNAPNMTTWSLAQIGAWFLDLYDQAIREQDDYELLDEAAQAITQEIVRRVNEPGCIGSLMDFHYRAWANSTNEQSIGRYQELRALMVAYDEIRQSRAVPI